MNKLKPGNLLLLFFVLSISFSSCVSVKDLRYFQDISDSTKLNSIALPAYHEPKIHSFDILSVAVQAKDPTLVANINAAAAPSGATASSTSGGPDLSGYMVDSLGYIEMPVLGSIKVGGLTVAQATDVVKLRAQQYIVDPIIVLRNKSFRVTVLGEAVSPGVKYLTAPKANILDLLGVTGDLNVGAQRNNILLLRHNDNNTLSTIRLDLTNTKILKSQYFYLQSNDVIYVEPNKQKAIASDVVFTRNLGFVTIGLSLVSTFLFLFRK
ncbi:polysaccharide biosynthesis/export family protein [Mucilaginibacter sp. CSA2-8R]|uniref:polysaccharide biosynthesis/export family protein n=1 Tax=Mucilaginibacter sp. CSA2-8R TaxID=3141542 RepID=UPI00315C9875